MRILKNGINIKWLLLLVGIIAISGVAIASTNISFTDSGASLLDALNLTQWVRATQFIDANNPSYYVDPSNTETSINTAGGINGIQFNTFSSGVRRGAIVQLGDVLDIQGINSTGVITTQLQFNSASGKWYFGGITSGSGEALCRNSGTAEVTKNGGATDCTASSEKVKHNIVPMTSENTPDNFMDLKPIKFIYNYDTQNRERVGFSAQEACVQYPEICNIDYNGKGTFVQLIINQTTNKAEGALYSDGTIAPVAGINYALYTAILTAKVQEQQFILETQSNQIRNICTNNPQLCS